MSDFWAVLVDLYTFARQCFGAALLPSRHPAAVVSTVVPLLPKPAPVPVLPEPDSSAATHLPFGMVSTGFVTKERIAVFGRPVWAFDTVITTVPYASKLEVVGYQGRFMRIKCNNLEGWVLKDDVTLNRNDIWPQLETDTVYLATDPETKLIRLVIDDEFFAAELYLPLRTEEFITYRLLEQGRRLPWGTNRPRTAGLWHELLKGQPGVYITLEPKTGSIMEASDENGTAFLAFVLAVHPDETVRIESVGRYTDGEFRQEAIPKSVWLGWRPVFIQLT